MYNYVGMIIAINNHIKTKLILIIQYNVQNINQIIWQTSKVKNVVTEQK